MTRRAARTPSPHEEIHIIARFAIGPCRLTTMYEGLAIAEEKSYRGLDLDVHAATMLATGSFPALDDLLNEEKARGMQDTRRYPAAGLLVTWIRETGGAAALKKAYGLREGTVSALGLTLGKPKDAVEATFAEWVRRRAAARSDDVSFLKIQSEAQERLTAGDYAGVVAAMKRALAIRPNDLQVLFNLASAEMRTRAYPAAEEHLKRVISLAAGPKDTTYLIFGHYQLGRLFDVQARREDALAEYRKVLELPDQRDAHRLAREAIEKPATAESLQ
jgi:tetratricopeptide (TPR) repeat protein